MRKTIYLLLCFCCMIFISCNSNDVENQTNTGVPQTTDSIPHNLVGMINGTVYCVPPPYEILNILQKINLKYDKNIPHSALSTNKYNTKFKKLINIGTYGVDIAYLSIFDQQAEALNYFATIKLLANQTNLSDVFDTNTMERIEENMSNQDSLLIILASKFHESDRYLKSEEQIAEATLIITGCWIESLYILSQIEKENPSELIEQKIAEHKLIAETILNILRPHYQHSEEYTNLFNQISEICYVFDGINNTYTYVPPTTLSKSHKTIINSESKFEILPEHIELITKQTETLRNDIIK